MTLRTLTALFCALLWLSPAPAGAQSQPSPSWTQAASVLKDAEADVQKSGITGLKLHVEALENALRQGVETFPLPPAADGTVVVLTDGPAETLAALAAASTAKQKTMAINNPYPPIGLYLAVYYDEVRAPEDAVRVVDAALKTSGDLKLGASLPKLYAEKAAAFGNLKRWSDGLEACDAGLALSGISDKDRARLDRSRAFHLVELDRLDDAEAAYRDSLKLEPDNALALRELGYIAHLRAGGSHAPTMQITPQSPPPPQTPAPNRSPV